jgi:PDZ domain-containing protein
MRRIWLGYFQSFLAGALAMTSLAAAGPTADLKDLWQERTKCVVAVEFYVQAETERHPAISMGLVIDRAGTVILQGSAVPGYLPPSQFKDFRVYRPGGSVTDFARAEYLGYDAVSGWHFIRLEPKGREGLLPVTDFAKPGPPVQIAEEVWGISLRGKEEDFAPVFLQSRVGFLTHLPQATALAVGSVSGPQLPVFDLTGNFVGLGAGGFGETFAQYSRTERGSTVLLVSGDQTRVFHLASEVLPYLTRIPQNVFGRPSPWLGVMGLQPLPPDVAKFLKLENQAALVISEVLEGGPAEKAGAKDHDIILSIDGQPLPRLRPAHGVVTWLEREVALRGPGTVLPITVLRGRERLDLKLALEEEPKMLREAERTYFDRLGLAAREFLFSDAVANHIKQAERLGVIVQFVKSNSPAAAAGLRAEDWVREIDGVEIKTYTDAVEKLSVMEKDLARPEFVLLISRAGETAVLRVKLH